MKCTKTVRQSRNTDPKPITPKLRDMYRTFLTMWDASVNPPSLADLAIERGVSKSTVLRMMRELVAANWVSEKSAGGRVANRGFEPRVGKLPR